MKMEEVTALLGSDWTAVRELTCSVLSSDIPLLKSVNDSLLSNPGKQLRPMLALLVAGALGHVNRDSIHYAAVAELLHNATLLHDDVVDRSATRRGKPTVASKLGDTPAVLVGDFWLSKAVDTIIGTRHQDIVTPLFSRTLADLAEGEMLQLEKSRSADTTEEDYLRIVYCKTASLFETACGSAAVSVDATPEFIDAAERFGRAAGIAFQIRDDIFDYGSSADIGKPVGSDLSEGKITLPLLGALKDSPDERRIRSLVAGIAQNPDNCLQVRDFVINGGGIEYATRRLGDFVDEALAALEAFPASAHKSMLQEFARFMAIRSL